jgi:hypothetical protein
MTAKTQISRIDVTRDVGYEVLLDGRLVIGWLRASSGDGYVDVDIGHGNCYRFSGRVKICPYDRPVI